MTSIMFFGVVGVAFADTTNDSGELPETTVNEWIQPEKDSSKQKKYEKGPKLIHNNGKPIENNIVSESNDNKLFAVYHEEINGADYEKYYFQNTEKADLSEIKQDIKKEQKKLKSQKTTSAMTSARLMNSTIPTTLAVASVPSGGYWRQYSWTFYDSLGAKQGTYVSNTNFKRASSNANIDGKAGSIWNVHSFNSWEPNINGRLEEQITRMAVPYSAEKLLSYGPKDDSGFSVSVDLSGITSPLSWTFNVGNFFVDNVSSLSSKYGRWIYTRNLGYPDPFVTEPGIRVSNTSGNLAVQLSHSFNIGYKDHSTGIVTVSLPDR
jgi:hypothetical protein